MVVRVRARIVRTVCALLALAISTHAMINDVIEIVQFSKDIGEEILQSWDLISEPFNLTGGVPIVKAKGQQVLEKLSHISKQIEKLELAVEKNGAIAILLAKNIGRGARLELRLHEITDLLSRVAAADRQMREYVRYQQELEMATLVDFAEWCVSHDPGALPGLLERVHSLIVPPHRNLLGRGLLQLITNDLQDHPDLCEFQLSQHQLIYDMYNTISLTEIKGYAMMQFSWMLLRIYGKGNFTQEASLTRTRYGERTVQTATAARAALAMARRDLYRCDPPMHKEGETYAQVTRLLQGYIENEVDMNKENTCKENCGYYTLTENHSCFKDLYCSKQRTCKGRIIDCHYVDSDMWVCPASRGSTRRYEWIEYENGRTLGKVGSCLRGTSKVDSWWKWNLLHCSYCMCLCEDEAKDAERFFSMSEANADADKNKVVTGLRLIKLGRVFHLQISEGTLGERGVVTPGSWVPVQKFDPDDHGMRDGTDYHMLTYERRAIDLDELDSPAGSVLTGVRFRMLGSHLHFEIRSTPFNFTSGRLSPERSVWISNDNTDGAETPRRRLNLVKPDIPTRGHIAQPIDSTHDQYLEFTHSDFEADAAQSTVPFIDIQPVMPSKGGALSSGAGIIHRGEKGSGGYIGVKLFTYDYSRHVLASPPPSAFEEEGDTTEFTPVVN